MFKLKRITGKEVDLMVIEKMTDNGLQEHTRVALNPKSKGNDAIYTALESYTYRLSQEVSANVERVNH